MTYPRRSQRTLWAAALTAALLIATLLIVCLPAPAQVLYGSLIGNITDATGLAVPAATVTITHVETGQSRESRANEVGGYSFPTIAGGTYTVAVSKPGFQTLERRGVVVTTNSAVRIDLALNVAGVAQTVDVTESAAPVLQTDRAEVRGELSSVTLENAPIPPGRNYEQLLITIPGISPPTRGGSSVTNPSKTLDFRMNGSTSTGIGVRIDGASALGSWMSGAVYAPSLEAVETVNAVTSSFDAEVGLAGGAAINVTTKSGTNTLHGSAFEYHNNSYFNARPYFLPENQQKPKRIMNQFGGVLGGPIIRNKLFYFVSYEGTLERKLASGFGTVPTAAVRNGDMSASTRGVYDPLTGDINGRARTLFPGNIVPASRVDPIVQKIVKLTPLPVFGDTLVNNYYASASSPYTRHRIDSKVNWNASRRLSLTGRVSLVPLRVFVPTIFGSDLVGTALATGVFDDVGDGIANHWNMAVTGVYTASPTFIIDSAFGYTVEDYRLEMGKFGWDKKIGLDVLGIPGTNGPRPEDGGWPGFLVDNYTRFGGGANAAGRLLKVHDPQFAYSVNFSWIRGAHNIRFGADLLRQRMNHWEPYGVQQTFSFSGGPTSLNGGPSPDLYNSYASFLLGLPSAIAKSWQPEQKTSRTWSQGLYIRDQWQLSRQLTLSYGIRWEHYPVATRQDRGMEIYDFTNNTMVLCGNGSAPRDCGVSVKQYFAPRIGLAWRPTNTMVLRAGYSISYDPYPMSRAALSNYPAQINQSVSAPNNFQPTSRLAEGIPALAVPDLKAERIAVPSDVGIAVFDKNFDRGYIQSWNFTVEKQVVRGWVFQTGYVGNTGIRLASVSDVNYGLVGGGNASKPLVQKFGRNASTNLYQSLGYSRYNAWQNSLQRRFMNGFQFSAAYTFSKNTRMCCGSSHATAAAIKIPAYYTLNKAVSDVDRPHLLTLSSTYELPFGNGKKFSPANKLLSGIVSGWQINGLLSRNSGSPFSVSASDASLNAPGNSQRADQVKPFVQILGGHGPGDPYFDPLAFRQVTDARFGTAGFYSLRGPGLVNLDFGLFRQINFNERWKLQLRAEAYNLTNTANFANPGANVSSLQLNPDGSVRNLGGYTEIRSMNSGSREGLAERVFQFGLRLSF